MKLFAVGAMALLMGTCAPITSQLTVTSDTSLETTSASLDASKSSMLKACSVPEPSAQCIDAYRSYNVAIGVYNKAVNARDSGASDADEQAVLAAQHARVVETAVGLAVDVQGGTK